MLAEGEVYEQLIYYRDLVKEAKDRGEYDYKAVWGLKDLKEEALKYIGHYEPVYYEDCMGRKWVFTRVHYTPWTSPAYDSITIRPNNRKDKFEGDGPTKTDLIGLQKWLKRDEIEDFAGW